MNRMIGLTLALAMGVLMMPGAGWATDCKQEIQQVKRAVSQNPPSETSGAQGKSGPTENWFGGNVGAPRARELLFNAGRLAEHGKEASCNELVAEARRAVGMLNEPK